MGNGFATGEQYVHHGYADGMPFDNGLSGTAGESYVNGSGYDNGNTTAN